MAHYFLATGKAVRPGDDDCSFVSSRVFAVWQWIGGETVGNAFAPIVKDVLRSYDECLQHDHALTCIRSAGHQRRWRSEDGTDSWLRAAQLIYESSALAFRGGDPTDELRYVFDVITHAIADVQQATRELGIGGLLTIVRPVPGGWVVANVGDCRAYHLSPRGMICVTEDDVVPKRRVFTRTVMRADQAPAEPHSTHVEAHPGDQLLVATHEIYQGKTDAQLFALARYLTGNAAEDLTFPITPAHSAAPVMMLLLAA